MFRKLDLPGQPLEGYRDLADPYLLDEVRRLAEALKRTRILHLSSATAPEGVREVVRSLVAGMRGVGLECDWYIFDPPQSQFLAAVSRRFWDMAQGAQGTVRPEEDKIYLSAISDALPYAPHPQSASEAWFLHDLPLLPLAPCLNGQEPTTRFWVCHADLSTPNRDLMKYLSPLFRSYTALVLSNEASRESALRGLPVYVVPPAIDPLSPRNRSMSRQEARALLAKLGLDPSRPIMAQVARFDPWKDPRGAMDAWRVARMTLRSIQLVLLGVVANRDDAARHTLEEVRRCASWERDVHLVSQADSLPAPEDQVVDAVQSGADIVVHLAQREGFGLPVAEAMWKGRPVIGTTVAAGVASQIEHGVDGFLVNNVPQCAWYALNLLHDPARYARMSQAARRKVHGRYLLPRLLRDYLSLVLANLPAPKPASVDNRVTSTV